MSTRQEATDAVIQWIDNDEGLYEDCKDNSASTLEEYFMQIWEVEHPYGKKLYLTPCGEDLNMVDWKEVEDHCECEERCDHCDEKVSNCDCQRCDECNGVMPYDCECSKCGLCEELTENCTCEYCDKCKEVVDNCDCEDDQEDGDKFNSDEQHLKECLDCDALIDLHRNGNKIED